VSENTIKQEEIEELKESLRRCPEGTFEAALQYRKTKNPELVPEIVLGIVERFIEPEMRLKLQEGDDSLRLIEDLGVDSLTMMEIIILVEETIGVNFDNQELREIRTIGEVKTYMDRKIKGETEEDSNGSQTVSYEELLTLMPQQPPFLFLQHAVVRGEEAEATYRIEGDEFFLRGHFKDNPIFPASILLESLGQLAVLYILKSDHEDFRGPVRQDSIYFISCNGVRCHKMCKPGDVLKLKIKNKRIRHPLTNFEGSITVKGERAAFAESITLTFDYMEKRKEKAPGMNGSSNPFKKKTEERPERAYKES